MVPAIQVEGVTKNYGALTALDGVSLEIPQGEFFGLQGPNGAGNTTLINILAGIFYSIHTLPPFWQKVSLANPFFCMIDGFRYGFFGQADASPWLGLSIVAAGFVALSFPTLHRIRIGYKLRH